MGIIWELYGNYMGYHGIYPQLSSNMAKKNGEFHGISQPWRFLHEADDFTLGIDIGTGF